MLKSKEFRTRLEGNRYLMISMKKKMNLSIVQTKIKIAIKII